MRTIFKYEIPEDKSSVIRIQKDHQILTAQCQYGRIKIWAVVDDNDINLVDVKFHLIGTGEEIPTNVKLKYVATIQTFAGTKVNHLFEEL